MKIERNREAAIAFSSIAIGQVFEFVDFDEGLETFMRIGECDVVHVGDVNAVNLGTGSVEFFDDDDHVSPVRARLVIG